jgi:hypothetical protein
MGAVERERGVFILECLDKKDPGSEGQFLAHMFRIMEVPYQYMEVRTREQFLALLPRSPYEVIHITTHGSVLQMPKKKHFAGLWFPDGKVTIKDLGVLKGTLVKQSVVMTACCSGQEEFTRELIRKGQCRYIIAPTGSPSFHNAIFFSHLLYHQYFVIGRSFEKILRRYDKRYKNPHQFVGIPLSRYGIAFTRSAIARENK